MLDYNCAHSYAITRGAARRRDCIHRTRASAAGTQGPGEGVQTEEMMGNTSIDDRGVIVSCANCGQKNRLAFERLGESTRCGQCKQALPPLAEPVDVHSPADFDRLVAHASVPVVVDYWAPWCGPCRMVAPELKKVAARQAGSVLVAKVNTDEVAELGERYNIRSIPTLAVFGGGKEVARAAGARPAEEIEALIRQAPAPARRRDRAPPFTCFSPTPSGRCLLRGPRYRRQSPRC